MMQISAPKGSKCPCGKRATATLMSEDGKRSLMPCCGACGLVCQHFLQLLERDRLAQRGTSWPEVRKWLVTDSGLSSRTIVWVLIPELRELCEGANGSFHIGDAPCDPDDFGRCYRVLKLIPGGAERMGEVGKAFPKQWGRIAPAWPELTALYELEVPNHRGAAPRLYARMKELRGFR